MSDPEKGQADRIAGINTFGGHRWSRDFGLEAKVAGATAARARMQESKCKKASSTVKANP